MKPPADLVVDGLELPDEDARVAHDEADLVFVNGTTRHAEHPVITGHT